MTTTPFGTFQSFLDSTTKNFRDIFEKSPQRAVITEVMETLEYLKENFSTMDSGELIMKAGRLAVLKASLGDHASFMNWKTNAAYIYKKFRRADKRRFATDKLEEIGMKVTQDNIEAEVVKATIDEEVSHISQQYYSDKCKSLFESIDWVMSSISWRLKELASERRDIKYEVNANTNPIHHDGGTTNAKGSLDF